MEAAEWILKTVNNLLPTRILGWQRGQGGEIFKCCKILQSKRNDGKGKRRESRGQGASPRFYFGGEKTIMLCGGARIMGDPRLMETPEVRSHQSRLVREHSHLPQEAQAHQEGK